MSSKPTKPTYPKPTRLSPQDAHLLSQKPKINLNFPPLRSSSPSSNIPSHHLQAGSHLRPSHLMPPSPPTSPSHSPRLSHSSNFTTTSSSLTTSSTLHPSRLVKRSNSNSSTKTRKEQKVLLYNIHTHSFRTAYPSILLSNSSKEQRGEGRAARKRSTSNAHTLLSPTIRTENDSYRPNNTDTDEEDDDTKSRIFPTYLKTAPKALVKRFLLHHHNPNPPEQKYSPISPSSPRSKTEPIPTLSYAFTNPPLLPQNQYMIVPLQRWTRKLEFNWRTRTYGLSEEEIRQGISVVYTRRQRLPVWVWLGRNFGVELGEGVSGGKLGGDGEGNELVGGKWREVWVERGV